MEKFKICPNCGERNSPTLTECSNCEADLQGVKVTDEATLAAEAKARAARPETDGAEAEALVKTCDSCGHPNPANARKCEKCKEDISDVRPAPSTAARRFTLTALDGDYTFAVTDKTVSVGRECIMREYLESRCFVSRVHADLLQLDGGLWVRNLSKTNFTFINGEKIGADPAQLHDGDILSFGGKETNGVREKEAAYFKVSIR